jgi:hypothetical protein
MIESSRQSESVHSARARGESRIGARRQRRPGGRHIVEQQNVAAAHSPPCGLKSTAYICLALRSGQPDLGSGLPTTHKDPGIVLKSQRQGKRPRDQSCLIITAFIFAPWGERHRDDNMQGPLQVPEACCKLRSYRFSKPNVVPVLELVERVSNRALET